MRKWVKVTLVGVAVAAVAFLAIAGTGAYFFLRHLELRTASEAETKPEFDAIRTRFAGRPPLVDVRNLASGDLQLNRLAHPEGRRAATVHVLTWNSEEHKMLRTDLPLWLMRFSSLNVLSHLGVVPSKFRLTAEDLARYGPGIVVDYHGPGPAQVLIWLD